MRHAVQANQTELSRRAFLAATGGLLAGAAAFGFTGQASAGQRHPRRAGTLRFATRTDVSGLDLHRNTIYLVSMPLAAINQGLLDLDQKSEPVPGVAAAWEASPDLLSYTFELRHGVLFHNGREVDAEAVKWNFERLQDPKIANPLARAALENLKATEVVDKYTVRCHLRAPSAAFPADVVYYPCALMAPDSVDKADLHPIGCGPFKFVKWDRNKLTELVRFENYFETDAAGFAKKYAGKFRTWEVPTLGTSFILFNLEKGPFTDKQIRLAAAHAIDHEAVKQAGFHGTGEIARGFYAPASPWYADGVTPWPAYDPDKAKFLLRQARAVGAEVALQALPTPPYMHQTAELVQAMWTEVGFKVRFNLYDEVALNQKRRERDFHADSTAASYRWDPDGWFSRQILSTAPATKANSGFHNERADQLIAEARRTADRQKRLALYAAIDSIVNEELPILYLHHLTLLEAGSMRLKGYQPSVSGAFSIRGGGIRTAWME